MKICIDAGHGINTPGKRTPLFKDGTFMKEFQFNVKVAGYLADELLKYKNVEVFFTHDHPTGKRDVPLAERTNKANNLKADLFVSLHANAYGDGKSFNSAQGTSTFIYNTAPKATLNIASTIHEELVKSLGRNNRGLKRANFHVLRETKMSAVLIEHAFMTNLVEAGLLKSDSFRKVSALATARAIANHYGLVKIDSLTYYKLGDKGSKVKELQNNLINLGFSVGKSGVDGSFGPDTEKGVMDFQRRYKLKIDGMAGPETLGKIQELLVKEDSVSDFLYSVQVGAFSKKDNAERLAQQLKSKGYDVYIKAYKRG